MNITKVLMEDEKIYFYYSNGKKVGLNLKNITQLQQALRFLVVEFNNREG